MPLAFFSTATIPSQRGMNTKYTCTADEAGIRNGDFKMCLQKQDQIY